MLPFYHDIVCISCPNRKDMGRWGVAFSLRGVVLGVASRGYRALPLLPDHWLPQHGSQHLSVYGSESSLGVVEHALDAPPLGRVLESDHAARWLSHGG